MKTQQAVLPELDLGPIHAANLSVNVMDLAAWEDKLGTEIAGLIGMDVLGRTSFRLDYERKELIFGSVAAEGIAVRYDRLAGLALAEALSPFQRDLKTGTLRQEPRHQKDATARVSPGA